MRYNLKRNENFVQNRYGYCYYLLPTKTRKNAAIYNLWVNGNARRKGHAKELLSLVIFSIRQTQYDGVIEIEAEPREDSIDKEKLIKFYKSLGLVVLNE